MILPSTSANSSPGEVPLAFRVVGVISALANAQDTANAAVRSLVDNMKVASGPQFRVRTRYGLS